MVMNCPNCGTIMIWLNGSISHEQPIKYYSCRQCSINVLQESDGTIEIKGIK